MSTEDQQRTEAEGVISGAARRYKREIGMYYHNYLQLDKVIGAQHLQSEEAGNKIHDEHLFIVVHQAYELWFKQILFELDSAITMFARPVEESELNLVVLRMERVNQIFPILIDQIRVLETITPLDFLEFRDYLIPASGFQSVQFRLLEMQLGLKPERRNKYQRSNFISYFSDEHQELLREAQKKPTLFGVVEQWLERTPFMEMEDFNWFNEFRQAVTTMLSNDESIIKQQFRGDQLEAQLKEMDANRQFFATIFDKEKYDQLRESGDRDLSHRAMQAALLINLYRDLPMFHLPFRLLTALMDVDEFIATWRYRHMAMVSRMIGTKIGTGGSSGYHYLRATIGEKYRVFKDLNNLSNFLIPRSHLPKLPKDVHAKLGFYWNVLPAKTPLSSPTSSSRVPE